MILFFLCLYAGMYGWLGADFILVFVAICLVIMALCLPFALFVRFLITVQMDLFLHLEVLMAAKSENIGCYDTFFVGF